MNIGDFPRQLMVVQSKVAVANWQTDKAGGGAVLEKVIEPELAANKSKAFYEYEEEPWLTEVGYRDEVDERFREQGIEPPSSRERYVQYKMTSILLKLALTGVEVERFRKQLADTHPELADKNFGFTLDEDASVKIIVYDDSVTESSAAELTILINNFRDFKSALQDTARDMMCMVDHDHSTFRRAFRLNLDNFHKVVDVGAVIKAGIDNMLKEWIGQVGAKADRRDAPYISVTT